MGCSLPGSSVHGISQARILEWVVISFSGDLPNPGIKPVILHYRRILYCLGSPVKMKTAINMSFKDMGL